MVNDFLFPFYVWLIRWKLHHEKSIFLIGLSTGASIKNNVNNDLSFKRGLPRIAVAIDLPHTSSISGGCMGEWVEEIGRSYHRVLLRLFGKDSQRRRETMYPFQNLWKAHRILPATKMRFLKWLFLKLATKWFENPVKESIFYFFRRVRNCNSS